MDSGQLCEHDLCLTPLRSVLTNHNDFAHVLKWYSVLSAAFSITRSSNWNLYCVYSRICSA